MGIGCQIERFGSGSLRTAACGQLPGRGPRDAGDRVAPIGELPLAERELLRRALRRAAAARRGMRVI